MPATAKRTPVRRPRANATTPVPDPQPAPPAIQDTAGVAPACRNIVSELRASYFERGEVAEALMATVLAKSHAFILGPVGTAKSAMVEDLCSRFGGRYWSILMDRQLDKSDVFGPIDIALYEQTSKAGQGIWQRDTENTLVDADIAFVDEVGKAGPSSLNPMLRAFNERLFRNGKSEVAMPLISVIGASNELLEPELEAMWDRFLVRLTVDYIAEATNFAAMLQGSVMTGASAARTTLDMADLRHAIDVLVPQVMLPSHIVDAVIKLRVELRTEQVTPSDRRWKQCMRLLQAVAFLNGRSQVDEDDLAILRFVLWDQPTQMSVVSKKVLANTSPITKFVLGISGDIAEWNAEIDARKGSSAEDKAKYAGEVNFKINESKNNIDKMHASATKEGRTTTQLESLLTDLHALRTKVFVECLNVPLERAQSMAL